MKAEQPKKLLQTLIGKISSSESSSGSEFVFSESDIIDGFKEDTRDNIGSFGVIMFGKLILTCLSNYVGN